MVELIPTIHPVHLAASSKFYEEEAPEKQIQFVMFGTLGGSLWVEDVSTRHLVSPTLPMFCGPRLS